ncbi:MAG TPA: branched-chain amino acid ABC transporter permease [Candidatus Acidoferrum sp.]|nr:branched-chain amino acid ABC transporter permease [Candidatus Acidoferrum sp.]
MGAGGGATNRDTLGNAFGWIGPGVAILLILVPILVGAHEYLLYLGTLALTFGLLAESWSLPAQAGLISFGHAAFFGVGAYASALLSLRGQLSPWVALVGAGLLAGLFGLLTAEVAGDLAGPYFSLATLAVAEILRVVALHWMALTEGAWGLVGIPGLPPLPLGPIPLPVGDRATEYYAALLMLGLVCATQAWIRRAPLGLAIRAIRQGEGRAAASGVDPRRVKRITLALSGLFAGEAGALHAHIFHWVDPASVFSPSLSVLPLIMAMFGGSGFLLGPVLGAMALYLGDELLLQRLAPGAHLLLYGGAVILVMLALPRGILGWIQTRAGLRLGRASGPRGGRRAAV